MISDIRLKSLLIRQSLLKVCLKQSAAFLRRYKSDIPDKVLGSLCAY